MESAGSGLLKNCNFIRKKIGLNLFERTLKLNGFPIKEAKARLKKIQAIPDEAYHSYIISKRQEIVDFHLKENPFYRLG